MLAVSTLGLGCGLDVPTHAAQERVCQRDGPLRIFEAPAVGQGGGSTRRLVDGSLIFSRSIELDPFEDVLQTEIWTVGECGVSPRLVASDLRLLPPVAERPELTLACDEDFVDLYLLDTTDRGRAPLIIEGVQCTGTWTPFGLVTNRVTDEGPGVVELWTVPGDPFEEAPTSRVVADDVSFNTAGFPAAVAARDPRVLHDEVFALTPDDTLMRVGLEDGATSVIASHVAGFQASETFVVWQELDPTKAGDADGWGPVFVLERATGISTYLRDARWPEVRASPDGIVLLGAATFQPEQTWVFGNLPSTDSVSLDGTWHAHTRVDDHRWALVDHGSRGFAIYDARDQSHRRLFDGRAFVLSADADPPTRWNVIEAPEPSSQGGPTQGPLWDVPVDGAPKLIARRATGWVRRMNDGRSLTIVDLDENGAGTLIVVDRETDTERIVDTHVVDVQLLDGHPQDVVYWVTDGERSGLWRARLPADR